MDSIPYSKPAFTCKTLGHIDVLHMLALKKKKKKDLRNQGALKHIDV